MSTTTYTCKVAVSHRIRGFAGRTWTALLTLLTLACVTPPAPANASLPAASGTTCDGGPCGEQMPAAAQTTAAPDASTATPPVPTPTPAPATSAPAASAPPPQTAPAPPATNRAEAACDAEWFDGQALIIQIGERKDDGKPLEPFTPGDPMYPYELRGSRFLFSEEGMVYKAVGWFEDKAVGEAALEKVRSERPRARAFLTKPGPYLVPESPTCKVSPLARTKNPAIDLASWLLEKEGVLLAGSQTPCKDGLLTKKVTVMSCDGMKNLFTDTSQHVCESTRHVDTCVYSLEPGILLLEHTYTLNGETTLRVRVHDVRKKKRLFHLEASNGGITPPGVDPETEPRTTLQDVDQDGSPEIVSTVPKTGQRTQVRKWRQGKFVETRAP